MTTITNLTTDLLAEMMGDCTTELEARCMMSILSRECVVDTDDITTEQWGSWLDEAAAMAADEANA